jgi:putative intracellular protease/amidase
MNRRTLIWSGVGMVALLAAGGGAWIASLPPAPAPKGAPPIPEEETATALAALKPPKRARPLIAIIGVNEGTETNDYLMPFGILARAGIGDVVALATNPGPVTLYPVLKAEPDATIADFDARHPDGADYVIVPAMHRDDDPVALAWIKGQAAKGATVIGVCAGAKVVANTGLLDGRRATTHWYYLKDFRQRHPALTYVPDRRLVVDGRVATTTGITAAMPMMLTLIEAIAGRDKAQNVAADLGLAGWDARHDSSTFQFNRPFALTAMGNTLSFWNHEKLGLPIWPGMDEVALSLVADAWSRTFRSRAVTFSDRTEAVTMRSGMRIYPDAADWRSGAQLPPLSDIKPVQALDRALQGIADRYGAATARLVAMQLEYPMKRSS